MDVKKMLKFFENNKKKHPHNKGKFKCRDCEEEIKDVKIEDFDDEVRNNLTMSSDGFFLLICNNCKDNEDY